MSLRVKILLVLFVVVGLYGGMYYGIQRLIVFPSFIKLEKDKAKINMERCFDALQREIHHLDLLAHDWSAWDDTYQFVRDRNSNYIEANLTPETFENNNNNLIFIYSTQGELVWGRCLDLKTGEEIELREFSQKVLPSTNPLIMHRTIESSIAGVYLTERGPLLIASRPIITSENKGPIRGILIMGRFLDDELVKTLGEQTRVNFTLQPLKDTSLPHDAREIINQITTNHSVVIRERGDNLLQAYRIFFDIQGVPALLIKADLPRDIMKEGAMAMWFSLLSNILAGLIVLLVMWFLLKWTIVKPVSDLTNYVVNVGRDSYLPMHSPVNRHNEIGRLAREFDAMVQKLMHQIEERKQAEKEVRITKDFLENIFETTADGIMVSDSRGYVVRVNKAIEEMLGFTEEELIEKHTAELAPQDEQNRVQGDKLITNLIEKGYIKNFETVWLRKDGSLCPIELKVTRLKDRDGNKAGAVSVIRDITERKKAEEEIKKTRDFLESVIENSKDGIMITDEKGYIRSVNTALGKMSRFSKEELIGEHASIFTVEDRALRQKILEKQAELFEKGFASFESISRTKDGRILDIECNTSMIKDENGNYIAGVSIVRDVTERKKMEQQLLRVEKLRSLGELAGGVAHDFNNVLAAILGRTQLLRKVLDTPGEKLERRKSVHDLKKGLELIEKASLDGADTVRRIQEFSRQKGERDNTYFTEIDINKIINDALEFTKVRWKDDAESKGIKISINRELPPLPPVSGSASELREVLTNIINNAIDAMPEGGKINITTSGENNTLKIKVEDTGIGISPEIRDRIFDPFFTTKGPKSTGLGMSVSYGIIRRHGGTITLTSNEGKGTTFTITLPLSGKKMHKEKEGEIQPVREEFKKATILVIDDEEGVRNLLCDILVDGGHKVDVTDKGSTGIELFKVKSHDLVFTDLGMPGMTGRQVAAEIKKICRNTPVILITGWKMYPPHESEMMMDGVDLIVNKPFQIDQVLRLVQEGMEIRKRLGNN